MDDSILKNKIYEKYAYGLILFIFIARIIYIAVLKMPLSHEEAYYWCYSQHPALGYFDHPPMIAWVIFVFTKLFGNNEFAIRLGAAVLSLGTNFFVYAAGKKLYNEKTALYSLIVLNLTFVFSLYSTYITPDTPLLFFWALSVYLFVRACENNNYTYWILMGVSTGCGLLSKYTAIFLPVMLLFMAVIIRDYRKYIPGLILSLVVSVITFLPAILWNFSNDFVSFKFQSSDRLSGRTINWGDFGGFWALQALYLTPFVLFAWIYSSVCLLKKKVKTFADWSVLAASVPMFLFFALVALITWSKPNWTAPVFITGAIVTAYIYCGLFEKNSRGAKIYAGIAVAFSLFLNGLAYFQPLYPQILPKLSKANSMAGWDGLAQKVTELRSGMPRPENTFLFGNGYQIAAELQFYAAKKEHVYSNNIFAEPSLAYDFWLPPSLVKGKDAVFVSGHFIEVNPQFLEKYFDSYEEMPPYDVYVAGEKIRTFRIFRCYNYHGI